MRFYNTNPLATMPVRSALSIKPAATKPACIKVLTHAERGARARFTHAGDSETPQVLKTANRRPRSST